MRVTTLEEEVADISSSLVGCLEAGSGSTREIFDLTLWGKELMVMEGRESLAGQDSVTLAPPLILD